MRNLPMTMLCLLISILGRSAHASPEYGEPSVRGSLRYAPPGTQQRYYRWGDKLGNRRHCVSVPEWDHLNVRSGPSHKYSITYRLASNYCGVFGKGRCRKNWCKITTSHWSNKSIGWVNIRYLRRY
ncbi:SH3 domain-containing protein [Cohaesibacter gelatinilyticus]|uniref:SH3 domain-containing protein n=2 Tax=Cohaesibacter gelatinilyticus TaxID=372072 RepID=A0A285N8W6_9HYPH|nr:SH3 domain-containing protein [Cohaesibacter gelatinilyticus]